ncbi:MAG TPA: AMP-binding protein, partial [Solirubrobacteraceae bacterium]|nr:AMP-binding protein [Solirubrobacteraceae bacterium]
MTMLTAFGVLVSRYTGQDDLVMATVVANRNRTELEGLIGCFTKKVPVRLRLDGDPSFTDALSRARASLLGALSHQDLPFEAVVQDALGSAAAVHGLVPHLALMFQGVTPPHELVLEGIESAGLDTAAQAGRAHFMAGEERAEAKLPPSPWGGGLYAGTFVILSIDDSGPGLSCMARGAFHAPAVRGMLERFRTLLGNIVADPGRPISELWVLDQAATAETSDLGRGPSVPLHADTLAGAFRAQVSRSPDAVAVRTRRDALTFAELEERSEALAARLRTGGVGPGSRVGTLLKASIELIVSVLAIWKAGAAWVGLDPGDGAERRGRILREADVEILIGDEGFEPVDPPPASGRSDDAAVLFYGSGRAAGDHGVVLDHGAVLNLLPALRDAVGARRHVSLCPGPTDDGFVRRLVALLDGESLYVSERPLRADPGEALRLLRAREIELIDGTPEDLEALLGAGLAAELPADTDAVVIMGTRGPVSPELLRAVRGARGVCAHVLYGPPECGFAATAAAAPVRG